MNRIFSILLASILYTLFVCHDIAAEIGFKGCLFVFLMGLGLCWLAVAMNDGLWALGGALLGSPGRSIRCLTEPDEDAVFADGESLVSVNTGPEVVPADEVYVHEYLWNAALGKAELNRTIPLSEWRWADIPEGSDHLISRASHESEFDEIERRLTSPAFSRLTNHGATLHS